MQIAAPAGQGISGPLVRHDGDTHDHCVYSVHHAVLRIAQGDRPENLGGLFYLMCDELTGRDWRTAPRNVLWSIVEPNIQGVVISLRHVQCPLQDWIASLSSYIKGYLSLLTCES